VLSVILPVRNGAPFIEQAITSALREPEVSEIIVIDDGSNDDSAARARRFERSGRVSVRVVSGPPRGPGAARNAGVRLASHPFLAFLDADDVWLESKSRWQLASLVPPLRAYSICAFEHFLQPGSTLSPAVRAEWLVRKQCAPIPSSLVLRHEAFVDIGGFDETLATAEDVEWFTRAARRGYRAELVERVLVHKRLHEGNTSLRTPGNTPRLFGVLRQHLQTGER
jgi:glycosyltransferase involved in cell wall biosynthesis